MRRSAILLAILGMAAMPLTAEAATTTWNPAVNDLSTHIQNNAWTVAGSHIVNIPAGFYSGAQLGPWADNITWEIMGARAATSIDLVGLGAGVTQLSSGTGNMGNGMNRVNNTDMTGITFKDMDVIMTGSGSIFGQWQNGGPSAHVTFDNCDVFLGTGALIGRTNFDSGSDDGQLTFINSNIYTANTVPLVQWDYNAGHPLPGGDLVDGTNTSSWYDWSAGGYNPFQQLNTANYTLDTGGQAGQAYNIGAGNGPGGAGLIYNNDPTYGDFIDNFVGAVVIPLPASGIMGLTCLGGLALLRVIRRKR